ncbi:hypothetical protein MHSWG343_10590 [Candidatus Mycoplasma haematohominis]|uniref:Uncharacterized protein n=1 Tax=Candidatus Mycoplasma haematohominis TaxID=1494318 RepID=A0A478FR64_9MOLU|nr:hypothetical protein MHSWG343_10590 [Candidatus Mycoplasma haemohominis]
MNTTLAQAAGGTTAIVAGAAATYGIKNVSTEGDFSSESYDYGWNKMNYSLKNVLTMNLMHIDAPNYESLKEQVGKNWRTRFAETYAYKSKLRSEYFYLLFPENLFPEASQHNIESVWYRREKAKKEVEELKEVEKVKLKLKKFYNVCWKVSRFVYGKKSDPNHYKTAALEFIKNPEQQLEEKLERFFRDAWVSCSESGSATERRIDRKWPYGKEIEDNEKLGGKWYKELDKPI